MDILLYATENARNLGSIVRTSAAFGINKIYLYDQFGILTSEQSLKGMHETSMGHDSTVELISVDDVIKFADQYEHKFATTLAKGSKRLGDPKYDVEIPEDALIMFGGETRGLPRELSRKHEIQKIVVPTSGMDYCLSLPVAYAVVVYEFLRQHPDLFPQRGR